MNQSRKTKYTKKKRQTKLLIILMICGLLPVIGVGAILFSLLHKNISTSQSNVIQTQQVITSSTSTETTDVSSSSQTDNTWEVQSEPVKLPILMYHAIHVMAPEEAPNANLIVDPATFESHLKALNDAGYYTLSPEEAYKVLTENVLPAGKKVVWLTFDDSLWDFYSHAYPLLKQYQMKATNNVITGFTEYGQAGHLTIEQIKEMQAAGLSFQGHTVNHPDLEYSSFETQITELTSSKAYLDSQLNQETIAIAYPGGRYSADTVTGWL